MASQWESFYSRLKNPFWSDPLTQTYSRLRERPGLYNLVWLSDYPKGLPFRDNQLALWLMTFSSKVGHGGVTLEQYAATHTLAEFVASVASHAKIQALQTLAREKINESQRSPRQTPASF